MSQLNISTLANLAGSESTPIADVINGSARAFVNFNGTGTVAIRASYNVSSITDNGTGSYTVNFTNAMPDVNYSGLVSVGRDGGPRTSDIAGNGIATTSFSVVSRVAGSTTAADSDIVCTAIFDS